MVADVGNSSIHIGEFLDDDESTQLTNPIRTVDFPANELDFDVMEDLSLIHI